jgi:hypothetical protein
MNDVVRHVLMSDKHALANLIDFPLRALPTVTTPAEFLRRYDQIFDQSLVAAIARADPNEIFCRNGAFTLGDGEIWAAPDEHGHYHVTTINPPVPPRGK